VAKYAVQFARTTWLTAYVEAETPDDAVEAAYDNLPEFSAHESGWGNEGVWSASADDWLTADEFALSNGQPYKGEVVQELK
jgi:hypothetical protein